MPDHVFVQLDVTQSDIFYSKMFIAYTLNGVPVQGQKVSKQIVTDITYIIYKQSDIIPAYDIVDDLHRFIGDHRQSTA
jgi:hypothetical protein